MTLACRYLVFAVCGLFCLGADPAAAQRARFAADALAMRAALALPDDARRPASGSYDVVALMVEFQPDTSRFTTGDGTFAGDPFAGLAPKVDPLPHDQAYFQAHLDFLKHYVERVSDDRIDLRLHLIPEVVRVPRQMGAYAPTGPNSDSDAELGKLARLVQESWERADAIGGLTPGRTAFVIFHAGVGRDIELIGTTLDKTPQDLPSLFFDQASLSRLLGGSSIEFAGLPVDHTLILPRTETRLGTDFIADEPFLLELSINGLLAASFFNFLGVPDLFDTETGESAIGPFGLMDPQGIFAYRGLFPPEPMAWTKQYLGWTDPVLLEGDGPVSLALTAASLPGSSESARAVISESEYFLVENRHRDPENDGLTLRVWRQGEIVEQHVENGDPEFNSFVVDGFIGGVVVGVDNYDWALPGGLDEDDNELNGGILIWHVDERRIRAGLAENAVNVGPGARAVDLEEADGAQDIGFPSPGPFGPQAELGTPFDFFYRGNPVVAISQTGQEIRLYRNRFGPDTHPSSGTNGGGPSFIVLDDFSEPAAEMTFVYRRTSVDGIEPFDVEGALTVGDSFGRGSGLALVDDELVAYGADGSLPPPFEDPISLFAGASAAFPATVDGLVLLRDAGNGHSLIVFRSEEGRIVFDRWVELPEEVRDMTPASPVVYTNFERSESYSFLMRGDGRTAVVSVDMEGVSVSSPPAEREAVSLGAVWTPLGSVPAVIGRQGTSVEGGDWTYDLGLDARVGQAVIARENAGIIAAVPVTNRGELLMLLPGGAVHTIDVESAARGFGASASDSLSAYPVFADFDGDRRLDVLVAYGNMLLAFSQAGAVVENFPIRVPGAVRAQPLIARFEGEASWSVIAAAEDGYIYAYSTSERQRLRRGFPLEVGNRALATPLLDQGVLYAVSEAGTIKAWRLQEVEAVWWGRLHGTGENAGFVELASDVVVNGAPPPLIDASETYNWPNPVQEGVTNLRIRTSRDARVTISIIDAAGGLVGELEMDARGGVPNELAWQANVQSGLYFARFTVVADDGERATKLVKMAVIK